MLELKNDLFENIDTAPKEHYTFQFDPEKVIPVEKKYTGILLKRMLASIIAGLIFLIAGIFSDRAIFGFGIGVLFISIVGHVKGILSYRKLFAKSKERFKCTLYDYSLYEDFMIIWISSQNSIRQQKFILSDIKKAQIIGNFLTMEIEGQLYLMEEEKLPQDSYFLSICNKK